MYDFLLWWLIYLIPSLRVLLPLISANIVCYPSVGCFQNQYPWSSITRPIPLPQNPELVSNSMIFYNRDLNGVEFSIFPVVNVTFEFEMKQTTFVIIHGYQSNGHTQWIMDLKDKLLEKIDANVLVVDYGMGKKLPYALAVANARIVAKLIYLVIETMKIDPESLHFIGHSLGSQIAALTSIDFQTTDRIIGRITGLDPAKPFFEYQPIQIRIDPSDAKFVDVWHTNPGGYGIISPFGHIDYYFNGKEHQPGCIENAAFCSHVIVHDYFIESLDNDCFYGYPGLLKLSKNGSLDSVEAVDNISKIPVGLDTSSNYRGIFLVNTNPTSPYCKN